MKLGRVTDSKHDSVRRGFSKLHSNLTRPQVEALTNSCLLNFGDLVEEIGPRRGIGGIDSVEVVSDLGDASGYISPKIWIDVSKSLVTTWIVVTANRLNHDRLRINALTEQQASQLSALTKDANIECLLKRITHRYQRDRWRINQSSRKSSGV